MRTDTADADLPFEEHYTVGRPRKFWNSPNEKKLTQPLKSKSRESLNRSGVRGLPVGATKKRFEDLHSQLEFSVGFPEQSYKTLNPTS